MANPDSFSSGRSYAVPRELIMTTIKPMNTPSVTQHLTAVIHVAAENELIAHRLEEMGERRGPERLWAKISKYATCSPRGFGLFNISAWRGIYGMELQKSLRRQANGWKHQLREEKIRAPLPNLIISGMSPASRGAEDGKVGQMALYP